MREVREALEVMRGPAPITAIFTTFDSVAELIYLLLMSLAVRVPEDVALVSFGGTLHHPTDWKRARRLAMMGKLPP